MQKIKKSYDIQPTNKQKAYFENRYLKKMNKEKSALRAGYSKTTAKSTKQGIESKKGWNILINEGALSDESLTRLHGKLLNCGDKRVQHQALDLAYKVKGKLTEKYKVSIDKEVAEEFKDIIKGE